MAKSNLKKELIYLDFKKEEYLFFNIEVLSIGFNDLQVITREGKLGNKGRERIKRFNLNNTENTFKDTMKYAYNLIYKKKTKGFVSVEKMEKALKLALSEEKNTENKRIKKTSRKTECDFCKRYINPKLYDKIDTWGRGQGNWDYSSDSPLFKKVICMDCQIENDYFQKDIKKDQ